MNPIKISAVIITFNEDKNIERCINSLAFIADEIIVLDSFSTDNTAGLLYQKSNVRFYQRAWTGFSDAKNYANDLATGDYILSIDADEELSKELIESITELKKTGLIHSAYITNRLTNYCGKWIYHCGWYPDQKPRIFKKDQAHWEGLIHEELVFNSTDEMPNIRGNLLHYSYPTIDSHLKKIISYSKLTAYWKYENGKKLTLIGNGLLKPWFGFIKMYFFKKGFADGYYGFVISALSAFFYFLQYLNYRSINEKNT
jgi:glycosyltransferase involved in cell wall biosynthesis